VEDSKRTITEAEPRKCKSQLFLRAVARVLFLSLAFLLFQCFVYCSDVSAQTDRRSTVNRERIPQEYQRVAQSVPRDGRELLREAFGNDFGNTSKKSSETLVVFFFLILLFLFVGGLVYYDTVYLKNRGNLENPWVVFRELCKAHQLNRNDKVFLQRAADVLDLDDPLPLFIEPKYLLSLLDNKDFQTDRIEALKLLHQFFDFEPPDRMSGIISAVNKKTIM